MAGEHLNAQARRVVTGLTEDGRSTIVIDEDTRTRSATPVFTICDVWRVDGLPGNVMDDDTLGEELQLGPPPNGLVVRVTTFPPDSEWDPKTGYGEGLGAVGGADADASSDADEIPGLHVTDTVDVVTVLSGEIYAVLEDAETLLKPGDTFIQRGTVHAWSNRSDQPATVVALMMSATR